MEEFYASISHSKGVLWCASGWAFWGLNKIISQKKKRTQLIFRKKYMHISYFVIEIFSKTDTQESDKNNGGDGDDDDDGDNYHHR